MPRRQHLANNPLSPGAVIRTNPQRGFWGCAVVLSAYPSDGVFPPISHIATTSFISRAKYEWPALARKTLKVVRFQFQMRIAPNEYVLDSRLAICMHTILPTTQLDIIGHIRPRAVYPGRLTSEIGDGTGGRFPLEGPPERDLGLEAVIEWQRRIEPDRYARAMARDRRIIERVDQQMRDADRRSHARRAQRKSHA